MKIYDISMNIHYDMMVYKNKEEKRPVLNNVQNFINSSAYESRISMDMHTGTHVDAPLHMIEEGSTIETLDLSTVITKCKVLDLTNVHNTIMREDLIKKDIQKGDFIILKTRNSNTEEFDFDFVYLEKSGAEYLKEKEIKGVGTDGLGIERSQPNHETHKILMEAGITIVEGLRLKDISEGSYVLCAPPLKIKGVEAAPTRALLIEGITL
ncbi:cyclase family protein [Clostridium sp. CX1]|uniref:cyclase family protein n=1 Tax=Clostridium sp. CX1 TaxID=2978346 RepID=UPI0021C05CE0|nr:cyclase family protein [Clostridium sp. CX1]MCT8977406.1 cyclase family protein [Clostridium sp. CX1]